MNILSRKVYYLVNKTKNRVIVDSDVPVTLVLSGDMNCLDEKQMKELPSRCKPYSSYFKVKVLAWLYDLRVIERSELVDIFFSFKSRQYCTGRIGEQL